MPARLTQDAHDARAKAVNIEWLEKVQDAHTKTLARCLDPDCGHTWYANPASVGQGHGCPPCAYERIAAQKRGVPQPGLRGPRISQQERNRDATAVGIRWLEEIKRGDIKAWAQCLKSDCCYRWQVSPASVRQGSGCPKCAGLVYDLEVSAKRHAWATAVGIRWIDEPRHTHMPTRAKCLDPSCGLEFTPTPGNVRSGHGCPKCNGGKEGCGRRTTRKARDTQAARIGLRWLDDPTSEHATHFRVECIAHGHITMKSPMGVASGKRCRVCAWEAGAKKNRSSQGKRDTEAAAIGARWIGATKGAHTPAEAECMECGDRWWPTPANVSKGHGCPSCCEFGYHNDGTAVLYAVFNPDDGIVKLGKTTALDKRLRNHAVDGLTECLLVTEDAPSNLVTVAERQALDAIADRGARPVRGWEYFSISPHLLLADVIEIVERAFTEVCVKA